MLHVFAMTIINKENRVVTTNATEMQETWVQSVVREDPLEKEMVPHSYSLAWRIPWTEEPGGLQSVDLQRVRYDLSMEQ